MCRGDEGRTGCGGHSKPRKVTAHANRSMTWHEASVSPVFFPLFLPIWLLPTHIRVFGLDSSSSEMPSLTTPTPLLGTPSQITPFLLFLPVPWSVFSMKTNHSLSSSAAYTGIMNTACSNVARNRFYRIKPKFLQKLHCMHFLVEICSVCSGSWCPNAK